MSLWADNAGPPCRRQAWRPAWRPATVHPRHGRVARWPPPGGSSPVPWAAGRAWPAASPGGAGSPRRLVVSHRIPPSRPTAGQRAAAIIAGRTLDHDAFAGPTGPTATSTPPRWPPARPSGRAGVLTVTVCAGGHRRRPVAGPTGWFQRARRNSGLCPHVVILAQVPVQLVLRRKQQLALMALEARHPPTSRIPTSGRPPGYGAASCTSLTEPYTSNKPWHWPKSRRLRCRPPATNHHSFQPLHVAAGSAPNRITAARW